MTFAAPQTVVSFLDDAVRRMREAGVPDAQRDAATLMGLVLGTDRGGVAARKPDPLTPAAAERFARLVAMRVRRVPLQHASGGVEFCGLDLAVSPAALIPRPETEDLVDAVLAAGPAGTARVADLGTGSGCIAIALAVSRPEWSVTAVDRSAEALSLAAANAGRHDVLSRITFVRSDFAVPPSAWHGAFDAVVSNPPYVSEAEWVELAPEVRDHEPREALVPGPTGHEAYAALVPAAHEMLSSGGLLALELGWKSAAVVRAMVTSAGFRDVVLREDLQGIERVLTARK